MELTEDSLINHVMLHPLYNDVYWEYIETLDIDSNGEYIESEPNRSEFEQFFSVLEILYKRKPDCQLMQIVHTAHRIVKQCQFYELYKIAE
tara:strand:+ start:628 stop:900 length:273 start_codon:yes stop_codon:yes gene_type:complete